MVTLDIVDPVEVSCVLPAPDGWGPGAAERIAGLGFTSTHEVDGKRVMARALRAEDLPDGRVRVFVEVREPPGL